MSSNSNIGHIAIPAVYHREYENDFPTKEAADHPFFSQCLRLSQIALPFISCYRPLGKPLSILLGASRTVSSLPQLIEAFASQRTEEVGKALLKTAIVTTALACSIFAHPLGMVVTTAHDMIQNISEMLDALKAKNYKKAAEMGLHLLNNALYLGCFFAGSLELSIASIGCQIFLGLYNSCDEFKKGRYLESAGHLLMVGIRGHQMHGQVQTLQLKNALEKGLAKIQAEASKKTTQVKAAPSAPTKEKQVNQPTISPVASAVSTKGQPLEFSVSNYTDYEVTINIRQRPISLYDPINEHTLVLQPHETKAISIPVIGEGRYAFSEFHYSSRFTSPIGTTVRSMVYHEMFEVRSGAKRNWRAVILKRPCRMPESTRAQLRELLPHVKEWISALLLVIPPT